MIFSIQNVFSQIYNFKNFSVAEGLSQSQVYALAEDKQHQIWAGTRGGGLSRFDGVKFTNYTESDGLVNNFVRALKTDNQGNIWIGTDEGFSIYNGRSFKNFPTQDSIGSLAINDFVFDQNQKVWIATDRGLYFLENNTLTKYSEISQHIICMYQAGNQIWLGTQFDGVFIIENGKIVKHINESNGLSYKEITSITGDGKGIFWVATYGGGINQIDQSGIKKINTKNGLLHHSIYNVYYAGNNQLWIGCSQGVTVMNIVDNSVKHYQVRNGLAANVVKCFLNDYWGNMWVGTSGAGLSKLDSERFIHFNAEKGLLGELIYDLIYTKDNKLWMGTTEGGVTIYDGKILARLADKDGLTSAKVKCLFEANDGTIWLGTTGVGIYTVKGNSKFHFTKKHGLSSQFINTITEDKNGRIWIATAGGGVCYFQNGRFYKIDSKLIGTDRVNSILVDDLNNVWLATLNNGIVKIENFNNNIPTIKVYSDAGKNIRCIIQNAHKQILVGIAGKGIFIFDNSKFVKLQTEKHFFSDNIYLLHQDNSGKYWAGTDKGLYKFEIQDNNANHVKLYNRSAGFLGIEATHNAVAEEPNGAIWFGSIAGVFRYNPLYDKVLQNGPKLQLTGLNLFFDPIQQTPYAKDTLAWSLLPKSLNLPYNKNSLSFQFIGVYLKEPESVVYSWKLEGLDKDWSPVTNRTEAIFSNLSPGKYTFKVRAKYISGDWSSEIQQYSFEIQAPFWQKWWFRISVFSVIFALFALFYYLRIRNINLKNKRIREGLLTEKKLLELEQKALHLQMNPHFIFNCLNSIKGLIAQNRQDDAKLYLNRFAKLMRAILDSSRENSIALDKEIELIKNYVELEKLSQGNHFELEVNLNNIIDASSVEIPPMLIQPFVENAILHGLKQLKENGLIKIVFEKQEQGILCIVEDNGIGRTKAAELKQKALDQHKSAAIPVILERLKIHNQKDNSLTFEDIIDSQGIIKGTKVSIFIQYFEK